MAGHRPNGADVEQRHADPNEHRNHEQTLRPGNAFGQGQGDEGVEPEPHLRAGRVVHSVEPFAQNRPVRQAVRQGNGANAQTEAGTNQAGGRLQVQRAFHNRVKQQHREQEKINQALDLLPDRAVEGRETADQIAAQNQGKIGKEELGKVHRSRITECPMRPEGLSHAGNMGLPFLRLLWVFPSWRRAFFEYHVGTF